MLFSEVLVPQRVKDILLTSAKSGRIGHAQLFLGQEGTHSLGLAIAYCQYIACQNRTETDSCGQCPSCVKFNKLAHPDLHFFFPNFSPEKKEFSSLDYYDQWRTLIKNTNALFSFQQWIEFIKAGNKQPIINVRDATKLIEHLATTPYESDYKFFIVWLPEKMNTETANKLLKTLEEPDGKTLLILVSSDYDNILPTILSRTQLLKINRFSVEEFTKVLMKQIDCEEDIAIDIAYLTDFNLQKAIQSGVNIVEEDNYQRFVKMMRSAYKIEYLSNYPQNVEYEQIDALIKELASLGRETQKSFLTYSLSLIRKCLLINCNTKELVKSPQEENEWLKSFSPFVNIKNGHYMVEVFNNAIADISRNANATMLFTDLFLLIGQLIRWGDAHYTTK